jgi:hypothetical protein
MNQLMGDSWEYEIIHLPEKLKAIEMTIDEAAICSSTTTEY